jgi:hypothetical protein
LFATAERPYQFEPAGGKVLKFARMIVRFVPMT